MSRTQEMINTGQEGMINMGQEEMINCDMISRTSDGDDSCDYEHRNNLVFEDDRDRDVEYPDDYNFHNDIEDDQKKVYDITDIMIELNDLQELWSNKHERDIQRINSGMTVTFDDTNIVDIDSFTKLLSVALDESDIIQFIYILNTCTCCIKHSTRKMFREYSHNSSHTDKSTDDCDCICRHYRRQLYVALGEFA
jgi:hypothetical protein